jgi:hypothetical protein
MDVPIESLSHTALCSIIQYLLNEGNKVQAMRTAMRCGDVKAAPPRFVEEARDE